MIMNVNGFNPNLNQIISLNKGFKPEVSDDGGNYSETGIFSIVTGSFCFWNLHYFNSECCDDCQYYDGSDSDGTLMNATPSSHKLALLLICINLPEIRQYFDNGHQKAEQGIIIQQYPVRFEFDEKADFSDEVKFMKRESILSKSIKTYVDFRQFEVNETTANVSMTLHQQSAVDQELTEYFQISFQKMDGNWKIITLNIRRIK